tara:strand:+ start:148 stop:567 length:420 start_codon:yes stop_codon:yes gene_type:complete
MTFKMKGFSGFKASAVKQTEQPKPETWPSMQGIQPKKAKTKTQKTEMQPPPKLEKLAPPPPPIKPLKRRKFQDIEFGQSKKGKPYFKPSSEVMHPPYRRPVGPTEKRHGVHRGDQLMDNLDTEFQPRKNKYHMKDRLKK